MCQAEPVGGGAAGSPGRLAECKLVLQRLYVSVRAALVLSRRRIVLAAKDSEAGQGRV